MSTNVSANINVRIASLAARSAKIKPGCSHDIRLRHHKLADVIKEALKLAADIDARAEPPLFSDSQMQAESMCRAISEVVPGFLWSCSANGSALYVNQPWTEYTGTDLFNQLPMNVLHHPDDVASIVQIITDSLKKGGEQFSAEFRLRRKDGEYRWAAARVAPVKDQYGTIIQWVGVTTDIHKRKLTELALTQNQDRQINSGKSECQDRSVGQRSQLEGELRIKDERFRATFERAAVGFAHISFDGKWLRANDYLCTMLGYERDELLAISFNDVARPGRGGIEPSGLTGLLVGDAENSSFETCLACKNGTPKWAAVTASVIRGLKVEKDDEPLYLSCVIQDITDSKQSAYALTKSLRILAEAEKIAGTGSWEYDVLSATISRSDHLSRMVGVPSGTDPTPIDEVLKLIHPDDRGAMASSLNSAINDNKPYIARYRLSRPDGNEIVVSVRGEPITDDHGQVVRIVGSTQDITANEAAEKVLEQRRRMSALSTELGVALTPNHTLKKTLKQCSAILARHLDAAKVSIWTFSLNALKIEAVTMQAVEIDSDDSVIPDPTPVRVRSIAGQRRPFITNNVLDDASPSEVEWLRRERIIAFAGLPLMVNKVVVGVVGVYSRYRISDINVEALESAADAIAIGIQRHRAEDKLRKLNADLEHVIKERTAKLQAALKELDEFTYMVAHELRAPLRGIDGFSQLVRNQFIDDLPERAGMYLERVQDSAQRMQKLIDDLLSLSYLSKHRPQVQMVNMGQLTVDVISELRLQNNARDINICVADIPFCWCDPYLMRQVITNLLSNSFKYTRLNSRAQVEVGYMNREGRHIYFFRDNGVGFNMEYAHKLFDPFQRLHRAEDFEGSGIGLAIVQRIINRHGGIIWAESQPGEGATFYISMQGEETERQNSV